MLVDRIRDFLGRHAIGPCRLVVAVSGGGDSTALLLALRELAGGYDLVAAHVNHHLRGAESDGDEQFVRELCARLEVPLHVSDGTLGPAAVRARGVEAAAREIRTARLHEVRAAVAARYIATAHHRDDQSETVLMRLLAGGGAGALRGIRPLREDGIIRPLLDSPRAQLDTFLVERNITARVDRSNADPRFLRNRVRLLLRELEPAAAANLAAVADQAALQWPHLQRAINHAEAECVRFTNDETHFVRWPDDLWLRQALLHRHIVRLDPDSARDVSAADLSRLAREGEHASRISVTRALELIRRDETLVLRRRVRPIAPFEYPARVGEATPIPELQLVARVVPAADASAPQHGAHQHFSLPRGASPLFVFRNRRDGDRFHPLGMTGSRKLKEMLIDRKVPRELRDRIPLLVWNGEIVWIAGVEISERFKISGDAERDRYTVSLEGGNSVWSRERRPPR